MTIALAFVGGVLVALGLHWPRVTERWRAVRRVWHGRQAERATQERLRRRSDELRQQQAHDRHRW